MTWLQISLTNVQHRLNVLIVFINPSTVYTIYFM